MLSREALRHLHRLEIETRKRLNSILAGQYRSVFRGQGMEFSDQRLYVPGDEVKSINWNVTARTGTPHVKLFEEERELLMLIAVDLSASEAFGSRARTKVELAAETAAFLAMAASLHNDKVGLVLFTDEVEHFVPPRRGRQHVLRIVRDILEFQPASPRTDLDRALRFCRKLMRRHGIIFLISDFIAEGYEKSLAILSEQHDVVAILPEDERERELPDVGRILLEDAETGAIREIDTSLAANRARLRTHAAAREAEIERRLAAAHVDLVRLSTGEAVYAPLIEFFRRRRKGRR